MLFLRLHIHTRFKHTVAECSLVSSACRLAVHGCHHACLDLVTPPPFTIISVGLWQHAYPVPHPGCQMTSDNALLHNTKYFTQYPPPSTEIHKKRKKTIILPCSFLSFLDRACLCLNSFSAPDAFLDILSREIISFSLTANIRADPVSDVALLGGT